MTDSVAYPEATRLVTTADDRKGYGVEKMSARLFVFVAFLSAIVVPFNADSSSWDPTLLVNTESFNVIDEGDGASDVYIQFGDALAKTLSYDRNSQRFNFSDDVSIEGDLTVSGALSGSTLTASNLVNCDTLTTDASGTVACGTPTVVSFTGATLASVQARRDSNFTLPALNTWYDVPFNLTDVESNTDSIEHDDVNTERILIKETGFYVTTYHVNANVGTVTHELHARVMIAGTLVLTGSLTVGRNYQNEYSPNVSTNIAYLTAGDYVTLQVFRTTANEVIHETVLTIVKLDGIKGEKGDKGDPGDTQGLSNYFDAYDNAGGQSLSATITVNLDTVRYANSNYSLASDTVSVNSQGDYELTYSASTDAGNNTRSTNRFWLELDAGSGFGEVDGTRCWTYTRATGDGEATCTRTLILPLSTGSQLRLRGVAVDGNSNQTRDDGSSLTIKKLR